MDDFLQEAPRKVSPVFFVVYLLPLRRMPCTFLRKCRSGLRGSALSFVTVSDGKPCSGVRGGQKASTDFPQQADARLPTLHGKGKTLFRTLFSPCKF